MRRTIASLRCDARYASGSLGSSYASPPVGDADHPLRVAIATRCATSASLRNCSATYTPPSCSGSNRMPSRGGGGTAASDDSGSSQEEKENAAEEAAPDAETSAAISEAHRSGSRRSKNLITDKYQ